jgi:GMP synthase (glutamine-hydrolysing)
MTKIINSTTVLRHVAFEDLGSLNTSVAAASRVMAIYEAPTDNLDALQFDSEDLLVVLGGPIGVYEDRRYPFLKAELQVIERALRAGSSVLGICLGAQLMARVLGARVYPGTRKEIGFGPVQLTEAGLHSPLATLGVLPVLHWHGDTFDLPIGAKRLAASTLYENQAFSAGDRILGLQFHLEVDPATIELWLVGHANELAAAGIELAAIRRDAVSHGSTLPQIARAVFASWIAT